MGIERQPNIHRESLPTLEDFDYAVYDWLNMLDIHVVGAMENSSFQKVPIIWVGTERAFQTKHYKDIRDVSGSLKPPLISISRKSIKKDKQEKGEHWSNIPAIYDFLQGVFPVKKVIRQDKTAEFKNNYSQKKTGMMNYKFKEDEGPGEVYEYYFVPIPVYVTVQYSIDIWTIYRTQMNTIQQKFLTYVPAGNNDRFIIGKRGHFFEAFLDADFQESGNLDSMEKAERKIVSSVGLRVFGYIVGEEKNQNAPYISKRETAADIAFDVGIKGEEK